jgi:hypothetical protein
VKISIPLSELMSKDAYRL